MFARLKNKHVCITFHDVTFQVYQFQIAAVTNYHQLVAWSSASIILEFWRLESQVGLKKLKSGYWQSCRVLTHLPPGGSSSWRILLSPFPASGGCPHFSTMIPSTIFKASSIASSNLSDFCHCYISSSSSDCIASCF